MTKLKSLFYLISILVFLSVFSVTGQTTAEKNKLEKSLSAAGYRIKHQFDTAPTDWEKSEFSIISKYRFEVRRVKPMTEARDTFPRYAVEIEAYSNEEDAEKRLERLRDAPPGLDTKMHAEYVLRDGFRRGKFVYVISTDAVAFSVKYLQELKKSLERSIRE